MIIRKLIRRLVLDLLGAWAKPAPGIHILNGHRIALEKPNPDIFRKQLLKLNKSVRFIRFEEAVKLIATKQIVDEVLVAFSFDDGFEECYTQIAPVLEEFDINAAFFINPNFVTGNAEYIESFTADTVKTPGKKPMNWQQIRELHQRGHIIGAHTLDHININDDNKAELEYQIGECCKVIEDQLGEDCIYFAFPFGRLEHANSMSIDIAANFYPYIFSQSDYKHYFSYNDRVINRRHFEPDWDIKHVLYFLSCNKK